MSKEKRGRQKSVSQSSLRIWALLVCDEFEKLGPNVVSCKIFKKKNGKEKKRRDSTIDKLLFTDRVTYSMCWNAKTLISLRILFSNKSRGSIQSKIYIITIK